MASSRTSANSTGRRQREQCGCGDRVIILTAWTDQNHGRRFLRCPNYKESWCCNYFEWVDGAIPKTTLEKINRLQQENAKYKRKMKRMMQVTMIMAAVNVFLLFKALKM